MFEDATKKLDEAKAIFDEETEKIAKTLASSIGAEMQKLSKRIKSFKWNQYTPYFNDGEPCTFGIYDIDEITFYDAEGNEDTADTWSLRRDIVDRGLYSGDPELQKALIAAMDFISDLNSFNNDHTELLLTAFGDGVTVIVSHDGVDVEGCDHD